MSLDAGANSASEFNSATSDFSGSFKFPTGVDVFSVAPGVTVNAGTYLVNNRFIDPLAPAGVPEPGEWALMMCGFLLVGGSLRTRRPRLT